MEKRRIKAILTDGEEMAFRNYAHFEEALEEGIVSAVALHTLTDKELNRYHAHLQNVLAHA
jgi:hypothetical protein